MTWDEWQSWVLDKFIIGNIVVVTGHKSIVFKKFKKFNPYGNCMAELPKFMKSYPIGLVTCLKKEKQAIKEIWYVTGTDGFGYGTAMFELRPATKGEEFLFHINGQYILGEEDEVK